MSSIDFLVFFCCKHIYVFKMFFDPPSPQIANIAVWTSPHNPCASSDTTLLPLAFWGKSYEGKSPLWGSYWMSSMSSMLPLARPGTSRHVQAASGHVQARPGTSRHVQARPGTSRHVQARPGTSRHDQARPGTPRHVQARPGTSNTLTGTQPNLISSRGFRVRVAIAFCNSVYRVVSSAASSGPSASITPQSAPVSGCKRASQNWPIWARLHRARERPPAERLAVPLGVSGPAPSPRLAVAGGTPLCVSKPLARLLPPSLLFVHIALCYQG